MSKLVALRHCANPGATVSAVAHWALAEYEQIRVQVSELPPMKLQPHTVFTRVKIHFSVLVPSTNTEAYAVIAASSASAAGHWVATGYR